MSLVSHKYSSVDNCRIIDIATINNDNGSIAVFENLACSPINIRRIYYIYDVPSGAERGGHSHHNLSSIIIALCGSFDVIIDDGKKTKRITLNRPNQGLLLTTGIWRTLDNFSSGAVCLVLASEKYEEDDYVRDYEQFKRLTSEKL